MKLILAAVTFAATSSAFLTAGTSLTADNFYLTKNDTWLTEFYSPWCSHCKAFAPTWKELVDAKESASPAFHFGQVDCVANADLCLAENIEGYPTIRLLKNGKIDKEYSAERDINTLLLFVDQNLPTPFSHLPLTVDNSTLPTADAPSPPVVAVVEKKEKPHKVAAKVDATEFIIATAPPTKPTPTHVDSRKIVAQSTGIFAKSTPSEATELVGDGKVIALYGQEALRAVKTGTSPSFVKFFVKWCHHCQALAPKWIELAQELAGKVQLYSIDCEEGENKSVCRMEDIKGYPTLTFYNDGTESSYRGAREVTPLKQFALQASNSIKIETIANKEDLTTALLESPSLLLYLSASTSDASASDATRLANLNLIKSATASTISSKAVAAGESLSIYTSSSADLLASLGGGKAEGVEGVLAFFNDGKSTPMEKFVFMTGESQRIGARERDLARWIATVRLPRLVELDAESFPIIMHRTPLSSISPSSPSLLASAPVSYVVLAILSKKNLGPSSFELRKSRLEEMASHFEVRTEVERGSKGRVHWAWIDGDLWKDYTRKLYGIDLKESGEGAGVVVVDPTTSTFWSKDVSGLDMLDLQDDSVSTLIRSGLWTGTSLKQGQSSLGLTERLTASLAKTATNTSHFLFSNPFFAFLSILAIAGLGTITLRWLLAPVGGRSAAAATSYTKIE